MYITDRFPGLTLTFHFAIGRHALPDSEKRTATALRLKTCFAVLE